MTSSGSSRVGRSGPARPSWPARTGDREGRSVAVGCPGREARGRGARWRQRTSHMEDTLMASGDLSRIRTNISALNALQALQRVNGQLTNTNLKLATGKRINSAGDDPAGLPLATTPGVGGGRVGPAVLHRGGA